MSLKQYPNLHFNVFLPFSPKYVISADNFAKITKLKFVQENGDPQDTVNLSIALATIVYTKIFFKPVSQRELQLLHTAAIIIAVLQ